MSMGIVDTMMVGRIPGEDAAKLALGAAVLGNSLMFLGGSFAIGVLMGLDPVLSQARGARDRVAFARGFQRGILVAFVLAVISSIPLAFARPLLELLQQPAETLPDAVDYARISILGALPLTLFGVLRQALIALGRMRAVIVAVALAFLLNILLNWVLIYGHLGAPAMGVAGSAWASVLSRTVMLLGVVAFARKRLVPHVLPLDRASLQVKPILRFLKLGAPVGIQQMLEYSAFMTVLMMMGWKGASEQAAHSVAIQLASFSFMFPIGVSSAGGIRVGRAVGAQNPEQMRLASRVALQLGLVFMAAAALLFIALPGFLTGLFTHDEQIIAIASGLLAVAAAFQLFDGTQVVALGLLRGLGDTTFPTLINLVGYWGVGCPLGYFLAFRTDLGAPGLWWGLVAGLGTVSVILVLRLQRLLRGTVERVRIES